MNELPPLELWKARSFWFSVATVLGLLAKLFGGDLNVSEWADTLFALVPLVTLLLAYRERLNPKRRLVMTMPKKETTP